MNASPTHLIFKFATRFMEPTNSIVNLKLGCIEICKRCISIISHKVRQN
jgi:hypothetical protein